jgi:hypothetical protein
MDNLIQFFTDHFGILESVVATAICGVAAWLFVDIKNKGRGCVWLLLGAAIVGYVFWKYGISNMEKMPTRDSLIEELIQRQITVRVHKYFFSKRVEILTDTAGQKFDSEPKYYILKTQNENYIEHSFDDIKRSIFRDTITNADIKNGILEKGQVDVSFTLTRDLIRLVAVL